MARKTQVALVFTVVGADKSWLVDLVNRVGQQCADLTTGVLIEVDDQYTEMRQLCHVIQNYANDADAKRIELYLDRNRRQFVKGATT